MEIEKEGLQEKLSTLSSTIVSSFLSLEEINSRISEIEYIYGDDPQFSRELRRLDRQRIDLEDQIEDLQTSKFRILDAIEAE